MSSHFPHYKGDTGDVAKARPTWEDMIIAYSTIPGNLQNSRIYKGHHNGCCLDYIWNTSNLDSNHYGGHCT